NLHTLESILIIDDVTFATPIKQSLNVIKLSDIKINKHCNNTPIVKAKPQDIASVIYTSGTSGPAKGVMMPHAQVCLLAHLSPQKMSLQQSDIFYSFYPMYHMAGKFMSVLASIMRGAHVILDTGFDPATWLTKIQQHHATVTAAHGP